MRKRDRRAVMNAHRGRDQFVVVSARFVAHEEFLRLASTRI